MKYKMKDVRYTADHGDSDEQCSLCRFFYRGPAQVNICAVVHGNINPDGWCMKFLEPGLTRM